MEPVLELDNANMDSSVSETVKGAADSVKDAVGFGEDGPKTRMSSPVANPGRNHWFKHVLILRIL